MSRLRILIVGACVLMLTLGSAASRAQTPPSAPARGGTGLRGATASQLICTLDPNGAWKQQGCSPPADCRARCAPLIRCEPEIVRKTVNQCAKEASCTPLVIHRRLDRLGCNFQADAFWAAANARPEPMPEPPGPHSAEPSSGEVTIEWNSLSCKHSDVPGINSDLDELSTRSGLHGRRDAYAELIRRGCNVDLKLLGEDGPYEHATLNQPAPTPVARSGLARQPLSAVVFEPVVPIPGPVLTPPPVSSCTTSGTEPLCVPIHAPTLHDAPLCDALAQLHDAGRFALCNSASSGGNAQVHFFKTEDAKESFTQRIDVRSLGAASEPNGLPPPTPKPGGGKPGASGGDGGSTTGVVPTDPTVQQPPPATLSLPAAAGSAGIGAALAGLGKWLFDRLTKKRGGGMGGLPPTHQVHDVHVTVGFPDPPKARVRRAPGNGVNPPDGKA